MLAKNVALPLDFLKRSVRRTLLIVQSNLCGLTGYHTLSAVGRSYSSGPFPHIAKDTNQTAKTWKLNCVRENYMHFRNLPSQRKPSLQCSSGEAFIKY